MQEVSALIGIVAALAIGTISPGPSFVMVARTAVSSSRSEGIGAALGMGAGVIVFATAALLGLQGLMLAVPTIYIALKVAGGLYLVYLGFRIWKSAKEPLIVTDVATRASNSKLKSVALGFATQISNPKTAIIYASVFATFLPAKHSLGFDISLITIACVIETSWYAIVAVALASQRPRDAYLRYKSWIDRTAGGVMMLLGLKLASSAKHA